jgi:hypothetical protein
VSPDAQLLRDRHRLGRVDAQLLGHQLLKLDRLQGQRPPLADLFPLHFGDQRLRARVVVVVVVVVVIVVVGTAWTTKVTTTTTMNTNARKQQASAASSGTPRRMRRRKG